jgi:hypothetical protein
MKRIIKGRDSWNSDIVYWKEISASEYQNALLNKDTDINDYLYAFEQDTNKPIFMKRLKDYKKTIY